MLLPLATVLLLLTWDPLIFRGLTPRRRYFFPVLSAAAGLSWVSLVELWEDYIYGGLVFGKSFMPPWGAFVV